MSLGPLLIWLRLIIKGGLVVKYFLRALQLMGVVSEWSVQALEDGKVSGPEAYALIEKICNVLGVDLEWQLSAKTDPADE